MAKLTITKVQGGVVVTSVTHNDSVRNMCESNTAVFKNIKDLSAYLAQEMFKDPKPQKKGKYRILDEEEEET